MSTTLDRNLKNLESIWQGKSKLFVFNILYVTYGKEWLIKFLSGLSPKDLYDLLEDKEYYDSPDFCKRIMSNDFTKISYEMFALWSKYYDTGILATRFSRKGTKFSPQRVWAIVKNLSDGLKKKFLRDNFVIYGKDLILLSEGKVGYRALRRKAISRKRKSINERFPFLPGNRRIELSNELSNCIPIGQYKKETIVNINGSEHTATLHVFTFSNHSDIDSYDYGYIFIIFGGRYIEVLCREFDVDLDLRDETLLGDTQAKLIDGDTETKVFVYYTDENGDTDELHIPDSTNLKETFDDIVSIKVQFEKLPGFIDDD